MSDFKDRRTSSLLVSSVLAALLLTQVAVAAPSRNSGLEMKKSQTSLPQAPVEKETPKKARSLETIKPPKSGSFYEAGTKEAQYEKLLDEEIKTLYSLSQQNKASRNRGEIWLRLGERYVEKARIIDMREQADYEKRIKDYNEGRTKVRPEMNTRGQREYNEKAVKLYEWFVKDFPKDPKVDQALFFLGYNHFELGNTQLGERYYTQLVKKYPDSAFITESRFALGEYYFENENWKSALENYSQVVKVKKARLNMFAMYKSAWCLYRLNRTKVALQALEKVIRQSRATDTSDRVPSGAKTVSKLRLGQEALKDYVPFYAEAGDANAAEEQFLKLAGNEKQAFQMLERLAYIYADNGNHAAANAIFRRLIARDPNAEKAAEYQYQIVISYATNDPKNFRKELDLWLETFGPGSHWAGQNAKNEKLVSDVSKLQETTLRNFVLKHHQAAQASRAVYSQQVASGGYDQYARYFPNSPKIIEMQFFHAELLFDMEKYEAASRIYTWVAEKDPQGPYREKAVVNNLLALEKDLPSTKDIEAKRGKSLEKMPLDPPVERFEKATLRYLKAFPKSEKTSDIKRRLGVLYYSYNHFDEALDVFGQVVRESPGSENAEIAGNLILDIYKLRGDMGGFSEKGKEFLAIPEIARSKFGGQVRAMLEKAGYLKAEKTAETGDALRAAKEFESFANANKQSELAVAARYKSAINYEKGGDIGSSIRMYGAVLGARSNDAKIVAAQNDSRNALARIYQQTGQLELAARQYEDYARANPKDPKAVNAHYNAGVLFDSLGETGEATKSYQAYYGQTQRADKHEVLFAQGEMLRKKGQTKAAADFYEKYLRTSPSNRVQVIQSAYYLGEIAERQGDSRKAKQWYGRMTELYKASNKQVREETARYPAEIRFKQAQETLKELLSVKFGNSDKQQGKAAVQVKTLREKYINEMKDVIRFDNGPMIVAALASTGKMFDQLAGLFARIPVPNGFQAEEAAKYKELIQVQVDGFKNEAKNSYKAAVDKASELDVYTAWTKTAQSGLMQYESSGAEQGEYARESRTMDWMGL